MSLFKHLVLISFVSLVIVLRGLISGSNDPFHNNDEINELSGFKGKVKAQLSTFSNDFADICHNNRAYPDEVATQRVLGDIPNELVDSSLNLYYAQATNGVPHDSPNHLFEHAGFVYDTGTPALYSNGLLLDDQSLASLSDLDRPFCSELDQPFEGHNNNHRQVCPTISESFVALKTSDVPSGLVKISDLDPVLKGRIEKRGFRASKLSQLLSQNVPTGYTEFSNVKLYASFIQSSDQSLGRTGRLELYVCITYSTIFLFEMKPDSKPPVRFKSQNTMLNLGQFKETFEDAKWSIRIGRSGDLMKTGADPSGVMALWIIIDGSPLWINLGEGDISEILPFHEGMFIVAVPPQLNQGIQRLKEVTTYKKLRALIEPLIHRDLDQLALIAEI